MLYKVFWMLRGVIYKFFLGKVGRMTYFGKPCFLYGVKDIYIGNKVRIFPGLRAETHQGGKIIIEEDVSIGQNFHITSANKLIIGKKTTILGNVFITDIDHDYKEIGTHILKQKINVSETRIGENCFIGYGAKIQAGTILGKQCIVGTNSVVKGEYPDYCVIVGTPAKIIKKYNMNSKKWERINNEI